jgi:hypothetical protein
MAKNKLNSDQLDSRGSAWTSWTPTWTNLTVGLGTNTGFYKQIGKTVYFRVYFSYGSGSSVGTNPTLTLPATSVDYVNGYTQIAVGTAWDNGGSIFDIFALWLSTTSCVLLAKTAGGSYVSHANLTATVPLTFSTGDTIALQGFYEAA